MFPDSIKPSLEWGRAEGKRPQGNKSEGGSAQHPDDPRFPSSQACREKPQAPQAGSGHPALWRRTTETFEVVILKQKKQN